MGLFGGNRFSSPADYWNYVKTQDQVITGNWTFAGGGGGGGSLTLTDGNGTTANGTSIDLGGNLNKDTVINAASYGLNLSGLYTDGVTGWMVQLLVNNKGALQPTINIGVNNAIDNTASTINMNQDNWTIESSNDDGVFSIDSSGEITDEQRSKGIGYAQDYSSNYTDRSLPDVAYVNTKIAAFKPSATPALSPAQVSGVKAWYDFTDLSKSVIDTSSGIQTMYDSSGNNNTLTQPTASSRGKLIFADVDNGLPGAHFYTLRNLGISSLSLAAPFTIYIYVKAINDINSGVVIDLGGSYNGGLSYRSPGDANGVHPYPLCLALGSSAVIDSKTFGKTGWSLSRFTNHTSGDVSESLDDGPLQGGPVAGTVPISKLILGDTNNSGVEFIVQEIVVLNNDVPLDTHYSIIQYFKNKYKVVSKNSLIAFGDSITQGQAASSTATQYVSLVADSLGVAAYNYGVPGATIGYGIGTPSSNLNGLYNTSSVGKNFNAYITFCYGTNEASVDANWQALYKSMVKYFIDQGFNPNKICMISPLNQTGNESKLLKVTNYVARIASDLGVRFADCYNASISTGYYPTHGETHPPDAGHALMAQTIEAAFALPTSPVLPPPDPNADINAWAAALNTAGYSISSGRKSSYATFINSLKSNGIYDSIYEMWMFEGGMAATNIIGYKGIQNLTAHGTLIHSVTGSKGNGTNGYFDSGIILQNVDPSNLHMSVVGRNPSDIVSTLMGVQVGNNAIISPRIGTGYFSLPDIHSVPGMTTTKGRYILTNNDDTLQNFTSINGAQTSNSHQNITSMTGNVYLLADNDNGTADQFSQNELTFASIGTGLTSAQLTAFDNALAALQTALSR